MTMSPTGGFFFKPGHHIFLNGGDALKLHNDPTVGIAACSGVFAHISFGMDLGFGNNYADKRAVLAEYENGTPMRLSLDNQNGCLWLFLTFPDQHTLESFGARLQYYRDTVVDLDTYLDSLC